MSRRAAGVASRPRGFAACGAGAGAGVQRTPDRADADRRTADRLAGLGLFGFAPGGVTPGVVVLRVHGRAVSRTNEESTVKPVFALALGLLLWCTATLADDQRDVREFIKRYDAAYLAREEATIRQLVAEDYRAIVNGKTKDFATSIAEFTDPANTSSPTALSSSVDRVHVSGDLAVAVGTIQWTEEGKTGSEHYTLVLRRGAGQWRVVEEHISPVAKAKAD